MVNKNISQLPAATTLTTADLIPVMQGGVTKHVTPDLLPVSTATASALAGKATPTDIATAISTLVGGASAALDTLAEIDTQLAADEGAAAALASTVAGKAANLTPASVKTAAYTAAVNEIVPVDATSAPVTVTLPAAPADRTRVTVKKIDATGNTVTVTTSGTDVLNKTGGSTTATLALLNQSTTVQYAATAGIWYVIASDTPLSQLDGRYVPTLAATTTVYVHAAGDDSKHGRDWGNAKQTIPAAIGALGTAGGTVELGGGTFTVSSTGRLTACGFTLGSSTVTATGITNTDIGSWLISPYLRSPALIATVTPGVSFTITDGSGLALTPDATGSSQSIITIPAIVVPAGVRLRGRGSEWTSALPAQKGILDNANTWIVDSGTGVTILCGHAHDDGTDSGQYTSGIWLEGFAQKGNSANLFGLAQINDWYVVVNRADFVNNGLGGALVSANANATRFADCHFGNNGNLSNKVTGGVVELDNILLIPFGPVKFDNCFFTTNYGWGIVGTSDFFTPKGARSIRISQGQFNTAKTSPVTGSGTHVAVSGSEWRSMLDACIFESADVLDLDVYDAPVTVIASKFRGTGGTNGVLPYTVRVNSGATLHAIGSAFLDATSYHVQVAGTGAFNWSSCYSVGGSSILAADPSGNPLALQTQAGLPSGSTTNPVEPLNGLAGAAQSNETCPRLFVTSTGSSVTNQQLNLTYFVATKNASVTQATVEIGGTASGGSATYIGVGLYLVNADGSLTLLASTSGANAGAWTSANAISTLSFSAAAYVTQGRRYAIGILVNSATTLPSFRGVPSASLSMNATPALKQIVTGQATMPATIAAASLAAGGSFIYSRVS